MNINGSHYLPCNPISNLTVGLSGQTQNTTEKENLISAIAQGNYCEVEQLLARGVDPNSKDAHGQSMLELTLNHFTSKNPILKTGEVCSIIQILIESGSDLTQPINAKYVNIFDYSFATHNYGLLYSLHKYYNGEIPINNTSWSAFFSYCDEKDLVFIAKYYPHCALLNSLITILLHHLEYTNFTIPVHAKLFSQYHVLSASYNRYIIHPQFLVFSPEETEKFLKLQLLTSPSIQDVLLHLALGKGNLQCLPLLLRQSIDPLPLNAYNVATAHNNRQFLIEWQKILGPQATSPLQAAMIANDLPTIEKELETCDLNTRDALGDTPLQQAIRCGCLHAVRLLSAQASENDLLLATNLATDLAAGFGTVDIVRLLQTRIDADGEMIEQMISKARFHKNLPMIRWLLEQFYCTYPLAFEVDDLFDTFPKTEDSLSMFRTIIHTLKTDPATKQMLGVFFYKSIIYNYCEFSSWLLDQIDDITFFRDDDIEHFYEILFDTDTLDSAFVKKCINKLGIHKTCFHSYHHFTLLLDNHEPLFEELLPSLYTQATAYFNQEVPACLFAYVFLGVCSGTTERIESLFSTYRELTGDEFLDNLLSAAIKCRNQKLTLFFLKKRASDIALYNVLETGDEGIIQTVVKWCSQNFTISFAGFYEHYFQNAKESKNFLLQVLKLQKPHFSPLEREEIALLIAQIPEFSFREQALAHCLASEQSFSDVKKVLSFMALYSEKLLKACSIPYGHFSITITAHWFLQVFFCSVGMEIPLHSLDEALFDRILTYVSTMQKPEEYEFLFESLQKNQNTPPLAPVPQSSLMPIHPQKKREEQDASGRTELFHAVVEGNLSQVKKLLTLGSNPNHLDSQNTSVLEAALFPFRNKEASPSKKVYSIVQALVSHGALCGGRILHCSNIFDFAFSTCNYGLLFVLHPHYKPHIKVKEETAKKFFTTCTAQDLEFLTRYYPMIDLRGDGDETLCHSFIRENKLELLIRYEQIAPYQFKKILHEKNPSCFSLLAFAVRCNYSEAISFLLKSGASFANNPDLLTMRPELAKQFLSLGMNGNEKDLLGNSALHHIATECDPNTADLLTLLLDHGADLLTPSNEGKTALQIATLHNNHHFLDVVRKYPIAKTLPIPPLHKAIIDNEIPKIQEMMATFDLEIKDGLGDTALEIAIRYHRFEAVKLLASSASKESLFFAARYGSGEIVSFLFTLAFMFINRDLIEELFYLAESYENTPVVLWLVENFCEKHPEIEDFWKFLLLQAIQAESTEHIQEMITKIKRVQNGEDILLGMFLSIFSKAPAPITTLLLGYIENLSCSFTKYSIRSFTFNENQHEFIKELVNTPKTTLLLFYECSSVIDFLHKNHSLPFDQLLEQGFVLCQQSPNEYLLPLTSLAITTGKLPFMERCFSEWAYLLDSSNIRQLLKKAITLGHSEIVSYLCMKLPNLQETTTNELLLAINGGNREVLQAFVKAYQSRNIQPDVKNIFKNILVQPKNTAKEALIRTLGILRASFTQQEQEEIASFLQALEFSIALEILMPYIHGASFLQIKEKAQNLLTLIKKLPYTLRVPYESTSITSTIHWLIEQIFYYCLPMNPSLFSDNQVYDAIADLTAEISKNEDYSAFLVALQVAPNKETAGQAFLCARRLEEGTLVKPTKEEWLQKSESEQQEWLSFALVFRDRFFIPHCYYLIKHHDTYPSLLLLALSTIQYIQVARFSNELENSFLKTIEKVLKTSEQEAVKSACLKAYIQVSHLSHNPQLIDVLLLLLQEAREKKWTSFERELVLCLGTRYHWTPAEMSEKTIDLILRGLQSEHDEVRLCTALALTSIPHEKGLLAALEVVQSSTWDPMLPHFGKNKQEILGSFATFKSYPEGLHNDRFALITRISLQLVRLLENTETFCKALAAFPHTSKIVLSSELWFQSMQGQSIRYVSRPVAYPAQTQLIRGLSTRKGVNKFREAVKDLIRKGAGSCELTDYDSCVDSGTWNKIGHIFASHSKDLYFGKESGSPYFSVDQNGVISDSALIIFPASYYEKEYIAGGARLEREGTFNNVLYRGIPHQWIKAVYLPKKFQSDIELLAGTTPIEDCFSKCTSDLFKDETLKELEVFRRFLKAKEMDLTQEPPKPVSFAEKIRYLPEVHAKEVGKLLLKEGLQFATEEEVKKETALLNVKMNSLGFLYKNPYRFCSQDFLLKHPSDRYFKECKDLFFSMLPKSMHPLTMARNMLFGEEGCFGLQTDSCISRRAILRVAVLLWGVKKTVHDLSNPLFYGLEKKDLPLLASLMRYAPSIDSFQENSLAVNKIKQELVQVVSKLKLSCTTLSFEEFCEMLLRLYLAKTPPSPATEEKAAMFKRIYTGST